MIVWIGSYFAERYFQNYKLFKAQTQIKKWMINKETKLISKMCKLQQ